MADRDARIEELWVHRSRLIALYVRQGLERQSAEDLATEVYVTIWRRLGDLPASGDRANMWLFGVARNVYLNFRRAERRRAALAERLASSRRDLRSRQSEEARVVAAQIWRSLSQADREVLHLMIQEGATLEKVARLLGCSYTAAAKRLSRARQHVDRDLT